MLRVAQTMSFSALSAADLDHVASGLGLEHHLFTGEGIDALAGLHGGLVHPANLHHAHHVEDAGAPATKILLDDGPDMVSKTEETSFLVSPCLVRDVPGDLGLGA